VCQGDDPWIHVHRQEGKHPCARCGECREYRMRMPEHVAIRILIGPEMTNEEAATILLGPPASVSSGAVPQESREPYTDPTSPVKDEQ
jgi:hypothetical protein